MARPAGFFLGLFFKAPAIFDRLLLSFMQSLLSHDAGQGDIASKGEMRQTLRLMRRRAGWPVSPNISHSRVKYSPAGPLLRLKERG